jgi:transposase
MTSRTNGKSEGQNQAADTDAPLCALAIRRQEAVKRYLDGEPIEQICQAMRCSKSWLYKWKNRYQVTEPDWSQPRSRRPATFANQTSETVEAEIIRLHQTLSTPATGTVSARRIRDYLRPYDEDSIPSIRTIYRILNRYRKEVHSHSVRS